MKKFLVLAMILGLSVSANGALTGLNVDGTTSIDADGLADIETGATVTVYVLAGADASTAGYLDMLKGKATMPWGNLAKIMPGAGDLGGPAQDYSTETLYDYYFGVASSTGTYPGGLVLSAQVTATGAVGQTFNVDLINEALTTVDTITFTITPEPMTIALLGLGGLFLRRRK